MKHTILACLLTLGLGIGYGYAAEPMDPIEFNLSPSSAEKINLPVNKQAYDGNEVVEKLIAKIDELNKRIDKLEGGSEKADLQKTVTKLENNEHPALKATDGGPDWTWDEQNQRYHRFLPPVNTTTYMPQQPVYNMAPMPAFNGGGFFRGGGGFRGGCAGGSCH